MGATLLPGTTGYRNIRLGFMALGLSAQEVDERIDSVVEFVDIGEAMYRPLRTYSSGMRARLLFGIATSVAPKILLIDEALSVGDKEFRAKAQARIEEIVAQAGTLMLVSHSLAEVQRLCTRALWIDKGKLRRRRPGRRGAGALREVVSRRGDGVVQF